MFTFTIVDGACGFRSQSFWTDSLETAEECRDQSFTPLPGEELCPTGTTPDFSHVCKNGDSFGFELYHCSAEQLTACAANYCGDPNGCGWADCQ